MENKSCEHTNGKQEKTIRHIRPAENDTGLVVRLAIPTIVAPGRRLSNCRTAVWCASGSTQQSRNVPLREECAL